MRTIWKFPFRETIGMDVDVPVLAKVVFVGLDPATASPAVWLELFDEHPKERRRFNLYGTGHCINYGDFVGSVIQGAFVWHVYEKRMD